MNFLKNLNNIQWISRIGLLQFLVQNSRKSLHSCCLLNCQKPKYWPDNVVLIWSKIGKKGFVLESKNFFLPTVKLFDIRHVRHSRSSHNHFFCQFHHFDTKFVLASWRWCFDSQQLPELRRPKKQKCVNWELSAYVYSVTSLSGLRLVVPQRKEFSWRVSVLRTNKTERRALKTRSLLLLASQFTLKTVLKGAWTP